MLDDFLQRFKTVVDRLMSHPQVRLTHVWIGPGAGDADFEALSQAWERPVPAALECLYRQANGLQLRWVDSAHETFDPARDDNMSFERCEDNLWDVHGFAPGIFDMPTLHELAERETLAYRFDAEEEHLRHAVVFDSFDESEDSVLYFGDGAADPPVVVASDHLADVPEPGESTLSTYLDHVLRGCASTWHRHTDAHVDLEKLLRRRAPLDPTRLIGQRVQYTDGGRGHGIMHGRVVSLVDAVSAPRWWPFAPTFAEVEDDLREMVLVPMRCLFPTDDDPYERLWAQPSEIERLLRADADAMVRGLGPIDPVGHGVGLEGSPPIRQGAWAQLALSRRLPADRAMELLVDAADRLFRSDQLHVETDLEWSRHRPAAPHRPEMSAYGLGTLLLDVVMLRAATDRRDLPTVLGSNAGTLRRLLELLAARDPLRGYDPLTDPSRTIGYLYRALDGGPSAFDTGSSSPLRGSRFGLAEHRVIQAANYACPSP